MNLKTKTAFMIGGGVAASAASTVAAWKLSYPYHKAKEELPSDATKREKLLLFLKYASLPASLFTLGTASILISCTKNAKATAAVAAAYTSVAATYKQAEENGWIDKLTPHDIIEPDTSEKGGLVDVIAGDERLLYFDEFSRRFFYTTAGVLTNADKKISLKLATEGKCPLSEYYMDIGIYMQFSRASRDIIDELEWHQCQYDPDNKTFLEAYKADGYNIIAYPSPCPEYCDLDEDLYKKESSYALY